MKTKVCCGCHLPKPVTDFYPVPRQEGRTRSRCIPCYNARMRARRAANPEYYARRVKSWQARNPARLAAYSAQRRVEDLQRIPPWANLSLIEEFYELARRRTEETGIPHEVDHEIPRRGKLVCGLHVETNLCIITKIENRKKRNFFKGEDE